MSHPKHLMPLIALCALLGAGGLAAAEPPAPESSNGTVAEGNSPSASAAPMSGSFIAWNPELQTFQAPAKDQMSRIAEDLHAVLQNMPFTAPKAEKVQIREGIYRMGLGAEGMSLSMLKVDADGHPVAACVQVGSLLDQAYVDSGIPAPEPTHPKNSKRPRSLPATEGWVEQ